MTANGQNSWPPMGSFPWPLSLAARVVSEAAAWRATLILAGLGGLLVVARALTG